MQSRNQNGGREEQILLGKSIENTTQCSAVAVNTVLLYIYSSKQDRSIYFKLYFKYFDVHVVIRLLLAGVYSAHARFG